ncbi:MAG: YIP1 family protein, partial [Chloroflexi bacterium]|nr:YIP1 family protein [Chloroflexota bacterium]
AAKLEPQLYEEVEADSGATGQALLVVVLVSLAMGLGQGIAALMKGGESLLPFVLILVTGIILALVAWFIFALLTFWLGTTVFKGPNTKSSLGEMLRTLGFAYSPGVLDILSFIPFVGPAIPFLTFIWRIVASVIAVRQACDFTTGRAIGTVIVAAIVYFVFLIVIAMLIGGAIAAVLYPTMK